MLMNALNKLFLALALVVGAATIAAAFPDKSVSYVIPFGPGGESDVSARLQQPVFQKKYGQELVITYKEGGGGAVGWSQLNAMPGDGYTIMGVNLPHIVLQPAQKNVGFKTDDLVVFINEGHPSEAVTVSPRISVCESADLPEKFKVKLRRPSRDAAVRLRDSDASFWLVANFADGQAACAAINAKPLAPGGTA